MLFVPLAMRPARRPAVMPGARHDHRCNSQTRKCDRPLEKTSARTLNWKSVRSVVRRPTVPDGKCAPPARGPGGFLRRVYACLRQRGRLSPHRSWGEPSRRRRTCVAETSPNERYRVMVTEPDRSVVLGARREGGALDENAPTCQWGVGQQRRHRGR